ncbi:MAG: hypothetical protein IJE14_08495 [Clostridia bacterium]|nr:hypothetical protein [Clostridia bacterium]
MITTTCFSVCGYFNYPVLTNFAILNFIKEMSDVNQSDINLELINLPKNEINHTLLFESGDYSTLIVTGLNALSDENLTPLSIHFKNKYNITSELIITPVDEKGFEVDYMLEQDELDNCPRKDDLIQDIARIFFDVLNPLYGCCGTEMFVDGMEDVEEKYIIDSKFYYIGYVDFKIMDKFKFINDTHNIERFFVEPLKYGNMYFKK